MDASLLLLIFSAIAIGWGLGRYSRRSFQVKLPFFRKKSSFHRHLVNEWSSDKAMDTFIANLPVTNETLETHLAIGELMRRRGEVERAIRIHQNILARSQLSSGILEQVHLELAKDYIHSGLYDRAEQLLREFITSKAACREQGLQLLLNIYEREKEWQSAISVAKALSYSNGRNRQGDPALRQRLAHYYCERAEVLVAEGKWSDARHSLKQALQADEQSVRASLLIAEFEIQRENYSQAIKRLIKIKSQDVAFFSEALTKLEYCYQKAKTIEQWQDFLEQCLQEVPSSMILLLKINATVNTQGPEKAIESIGEYLESYPSLALLIKWLEIIEQSHEAIKGASLSPENIAVILTILKKLAAQQASYQCQSCGFSGHVLHWLCPSCKSWSAIKPVNTVTESRSLQDGLVKKASQPIAVRH